MTIDQVREVCKAAGIDPIEASRDVLRESYEDLVQSLFEDPSVADYFRVVLADLDAARRASTVDGPQLSKLEAQGLREFLTSFSKMREDDGRPPLTHQEREDVELAYGCGCRDIEAALEKRGAIRNAPVQTEGAQRP